jgi:hypothetical protein
VADDLLVKSFDQTRRAAEYITGGGRQFAARQGGTLQTLLSDEVVSPVEIVVSFERIDPFGVSAGNLVDEEAEHPVWVTNLADFLMVRDVLNDPASFLHYAKARCEITRRRIQAYVESDALGGYLVDRLGRVLGPHEGDDEAQVILGYGSGPLNDYYTKLEVGVKADLPSVGVPGPIRQALRATGLADNSPSWWYAAAEIMAMDDGDWKRWHKFQRRRRLDLPFIAPGRFVALVVSESASNPEIRDGDPPTLVVPAPAAHRSHSGHEAQST